MPVFNELITMFIAKCYKVVEVIYTVKGEFVFILYHPVTFWPAIHARIRYINNVTGYFVMFSAKPLNEDFKMSPTAQEALEFELVTVAEEMLKCMCVKNVMLRT